MRNPSDFACGGQTIHDRHLDIHEHRIISLQAEHIDGNGSVVGSIDFQTRILQQITCNFLIDFIILDQQNQFPSHVRQ